MRFCRLSLRHEGVLGFGRLVVSLTIHPQNRTVRPSSCAVLHMSRIECKWAKSFVLPHLHSIRLMWSTASELGLKFIILKILQNDSDTGRIFSRPPLITFKRDKNIGNFLVRTAFQTNDQPETFKCARAQRKTCHFICNVDKLSGPKRSIKITDHFTCTSTNVKISCGVFWSCSSTA